MRDTLENQPTEFIAFAHATNKSRGSQAEGMLRIVAEKTSVPMVEILSTKRSASIVEARHILLYLVRTITEWSYPEMATMFKLDHTTIIHAVKKIEGRLEMDSDFQSDMSVLEDEITRRVYENQSGKA